MPPNFTGMDFTIDHHHHHHQQLGLLKSHLVGDSITSTSCADNNNSNSNDCVVNYLLSNPQQQPQQQQQQTSGFICGSSSTANSLDKLSFADVMQFADFGPKLALNQTSSKNVNTAVSDVDDQAGMMDPVYSYLKFPVLNNDKFEDQPLVVPVQSEDHEDHQVRFKAAVTSTGEEDGGREDEEARVSGNNTTLVQLQFLGDQDNQITKNPSSEVLPNNNKNKRKRPRTIKTSEEVESQRMTHIAVERNRRKQMNEHLRVLRSLMPGSYVQRVYIYTHTYVV